MLKKILLLVVMTGLLAGVSAQAAPVTIDLIDVFESGRKPVKDGELRLGDDWLTRDNLDFFNRKNITGKFRLAEPWEPEGTVSIFMSYAGVDMDNNYFSINGYDFAPLDPGLESMTWTADPGEFRLKDRGKNTVKFHLDSWGRDLDDFDITVFTLTYNGPAGGGASPVPLPSAALLLGCGLIGLAGFRRTRAKQ